MRKEYSFTCFFKLLSSTKMIKFRQLSLFFIFFNISQYANSQSNGVVDFSFTESQDGKAYFSAIITLDNDSLVSKIFLEVYNVNNNELLHSVNYDVNTSLFSNSNGVILFERKLNKFYINSGIDILFTSCSFKVYTEDLNGLKSEVILDIK